MDYGIRKFEEEWSIQMPILAQLAESKSRDWNRVIHSIPSLRERFQIENLNIPFQRTYTPRYKYAYKFHRDEEAL